MASSAGLLATSIAVAAVPAAQVLLKMPDTIRPVGPTWLLTGFVVALVAVQLVVWRHGQQPRQRAAHYRAQLDQGRQPPLSTPRRTK